jgi:hypothetical protein
MPNFAFRYVLLFCSLLLVIGVGCSTPPFYRVVYVPPGKAVRLRADIPNAAVWIRLKTGEVVPAKFDLKEGWYVLPDPGKGAAK